MSNRINISGKDQVDISSHPAFSKWDDFELPPLTENDYGMRWPATASQCTKEIVCFKLARYKQKDSYPDILTPFEHFLNIVRYLWPDTINLYKDVVKGGVYKQTGRIWNNYSLDVIKKLCKLKRKKTILCGPASANKTYIAACYAFCCYLSAPHETMVMVSTTSGPASERRIWGSIKEIYRKAKFRENSIDPPGEIVEYLKAITFDPEKQLGGAERNSRDMRNGMIVIPIANDSTGESALDTIQGTKNICVIWLVDEMAQMQEGVTRPNRNLIFNPYFQFIGIGNSKSEFDPHGRECMPKGGLSSLNVDVDRNWVSAKGASVLFLHGDESPNNHPFIDQDKIKEQMDYPFPYASSRLLSNEVAIECGDGDIEAGRQTIDFWKFCIGFWPPLDATSSLYSKNLIVSNNANLPHERLIGGFRDFAGLDFAFTVGGDDNTMLTARFGIDAYGQKRINIAANTKSIKVKANSKDEFIKATAIEYVNQIRAHEYLAYNDVGADTGNDAALMLNEMSRQAKTHDFVGISSSGNANNKEKYKGKITELWFQARDLIRTGLLRGINIESKYFNQLCSRRYFSIAKNMYQIEKKEDMKDRIGRSPDDADAFIYLCHMIIRSGVVADEMAKAKAIRTKEEEKMERIESGDFDPRDPFIVARERMKPAGDETVSQLTAFGSEELDYESVW